MKKWKSSLLALAIMGASASSFAAPQELNKIVTTVNDSVILQSDVSNMLKTVHLNAAGHDQPLPPESILRQQIMDQLIMETLQVQQAKQMGIRIDDSQLEQAIGQICQRAKYVDRSATPAISSIRYFIC